MNFLVSKSIRRTIMGIIAIAGVIGIANIHYAIEQQKLDEALRTQKAVISAQANVYALDAEQKKDDFINSHRSFIFKVVNQDSTSGGTGFLVKAPSGKVFLMTNEHVCGVSPTENIFVTNDAFTMYTKKVGIYRYHDLCLIEWPGNHGLSVAPAVRNTQNIYIIGHPLLEPLATTKGQISGETMISVLIGFDLGEKCKGEGYEELGSNIGGRSFDAISMPFTKQFGFFFGVPCIRHLTANPVTAKIHPGNSGSPVLDAGGRVVGVAFAGGARDYIIPLRFIQAFLKGK